MFSRSTWIIGLLSGGLKQLKDTAAYGKKDLNGNQYTSRTTRNFTEAFGLMAGLDYGAMLGSAVLPGVGTFAGTILGAIVGERLGNRIGDEIGKSIFERENSQDLSLTAINEIR